MQKLLKLKVIKQTTQFKNMKKAFIDISPNRYTDIQGHITLENSKINHQ